MNIDLTLTELINSVQNLTKGSSMKRVLINKVRCKKCNDIIESKHSYDFKRCECGEIFIDGEQIIKNMGGDQTSLKKNQKQKIILISVIPFIKTK